MNGAADPTHGTAPAFDRSVAFWLRAYPRRWRTRRADEVAAVLADLAPDGARRLDLRTAAGLVRSGWATRWRTHPPLGVYLRYALLEQRVPLRYREWAADDIEGALLPARLLLRAVGLWLAVVTWKVVTGRSTGASAGFGVLMLAACTVVWTVRGPARRVAMARKQLVPQDGEPVVAGSRAFVWAPRDRVHARPGARAAVALSGLAAVAGSVAWLLGAHRTAPVRCRVACVEVSGGRVGASVLLLAVLAGALLVGTGLAVLARRRLARLLPARPAQGARRLVPLGWRQRTIFLAIGVPVLADLVLEATGRFPVWAAPAVAVAGVALLPVVLLARRVARRGPADVAWCDVSRIVRTGQAPRVDTYVTVLVPLPGEPDEGGGWKAAPPDAAGRPAADWVH